MNARVNTRIYTTAGEVLYKPVLCTCTFAIFIGAYSSTNGPYLINPMQFNYLQYHFWMLTIDLDNHVGNYHARLHALTSGSARCGELIIAAALRLVSRIIVIVLLHTVFWVLVYGGFYVHPSPAYGVFTHHIWRHSLAMRSDTRFQILEFWLALFLIIIANIRNYVCSETSSFNLHEHWSHYQQQQHVNRCWYTLTTEMLGQRCITSKYSLL